MILTTIISCGHRKTATGGDVDNVKPEIITINPFELESITDNKIEITFSKPIDRTSILSGIYIYPPILNKKFKWDGNTLIIQILEDLEENTNYYFSFTTRIAGEHGNKLAKDYTYIFRNGELNENRISGNIIYESGNDRGKQVKLILQAADSTFIFSRYISGSSYAVDYLNSGSHIIKAFIDNNKNERYDYSLDPFFQTISGDIAVQTIDLEITYQDTIAPDLVKATPISSTQIYLELSEPCNSYQEISIQSADSLRSEVQLHAASLIENDLKILCEPLDTLNYEVILKGLKDLKNNSNKEIAILINGITVQDTFPPYVISTEPGNGATLQTLSPEFQIRFSEIVFSKDLQINLSSNEDKTKIGMLIEQGDSEIIILKPAVKLKNYSTYTLNIDAIDPSGNKLEEELILTFIPVISDSK